MSSTPSFSTARTVAAWSVHFYTALGLPLMFLAASELLTNFNAVEKDASWFFVWIWIAVLVDSTDGFLARAVDVKAVLPEFSGRRLDDLVDFLSFAFLPALAFVVFDLFPPNWEMFAVIPLMASGYGFCQEKAKTDDAFVGFPSYWNVVCLYLYIFEVDPWINLGIVGFLAFMVFVPIHYLYPTRTRLLRPLTLALSGVWGIALILLSLWPHESWTFTTACFSLAFPIYYLVLSIVHHIRVHRIG